MLLGMVSPGRKAAPVPGRGRCAVLRVGPPYRSASLTRGRYPAHARGKGNIELHRHVEAYVPRIKPDGCPIPGKLPLFLSYPAPPEERGSAQNRDLWLEHRISAVYVRLALLLARTDVGRDISCLKASILVRADMANL